MTKTSYLLIAIAAVAAVPAAASAGYSHKPQVGITTSSTYGSLVGARRSSDSLQYIHCDVRDSYTTCIARNSSGTMSSCYSYAPEVREAAGSISPSSMIRFQVGSGGVCNWVSIGAGSQWLE